MILRWRRFYEAGPFDSGVFEPGPLLAVSFYLLPLHSLAPVLRPPGKRASISAALKVSHQGKTKFSLKNLEDAEFNKE